MSPLETFNLVKERCLLVNLNIRTEMHGDARESAIDIALEFSGANNLLLKLHPDLRATFYKADATKDLVDSDHMPHLRFPMMGSVSWDLEIPRTLLRVHDVDSEDHDVILGGGKTNKFKLTMLEGGTVKWNFRVQFSKPDEEQVAKLMRVLNQKVPVSLECVDAEEEPDNFEQAEQITKEPKSAAREKAESLFSQSSTAEVFDASLEKAFTDAVARGDDDVVDAEFMEEKPAETPVKAKRGSKKELATIE